MGARQKKEAVARPQTQVVVPFDELHKVLDRVLQNQNDAFATQSNSLESYAKLVEQNHSSIYQ